MALIPATQPALASIAPHDPGRILDAEMINYVLNRGRFDDADRAAIAEGARRAPLDARPYLFVASERLAAGDTKGIIPLLEAGRRLDPQQSWIRLYLIEQYLRAGRYDAAMTEFSVISRLVSDANGPIVAELVRLSGDPAMSGAIRKMFARDPKLEESVLAGLAQAGTPPREIFALASPAGRAAAGKPGGWGSQLVSALAAKRDYAGALAAWQAIYGVKAVTPAKSLYDGEFKGLPGSPPFNWTFVANEVGAADRGNDGLTINYYGRDIGEVANQLMLLPPGQYRLAFAFSGPQPSNGGPTLSWRVTCDQHENPALLDGAVPAATENVRSAALQFSVPAENCPAQWLRLMGNPGQYPGTVVATIRRVTIQRVQEKP